MTRQARPIQEIALTIERDRDRLRSLVAEAATGGLDGDGFREVARLQTDCHAFLSACGGFAGLDPISLGFDWGEEIRNDAAPGVVAIVRTGALVEIAGEAMTLLQATVHLSASTGRPVRLGHWRGRAGSVGVLAGLEHPVAAAAAAPSEDTTYDLFA